MAKRRRPGPTGKKSDKRVEAPRVAVGQQRGPIQPPSHLIDVCPECETRYYSYGDGPVGCYPFVIEDDRDGEETVTQYLCGNGICVGIVAVSVETADGDQFFFVPDRRAL